jgi:hypothetical protein
MIGRPQPSQPRKLPHCKLLDPRILDQIDERDLQRFERADGKQTAAEREMRLRVGGRGPKQGSRGVTLHAAINFR